MEKPISLSKRLRTAAEQVRMGTRVADVGCDHGKLAAWLIQSGRAAFVTATDLRPMPLEKARTLFAQMHMEDRTQTVLCDGLSGVDPADAQDVVVAGLGADSIVDILRAAPWLRDPQRRLILVPASHHERLRRMLYADGFALLSETAVFESGHAYTVMRAFWSGQSERIGAGFAAIGLLRPDTEDAKRYMEGQRRKAQALLESGASDEKRQAALSVLRYIQEVTS